MGTAGLGGGGSEREGRVGFFGVGGAGLYGPRLSEPCRWSQLHRRRDCFHTRAAVATKRASNAIMFGCGGC